MNENRMSRFEAVTLLEACLPLVHKLDDHGFNLKQIDLDRALDPGQGIGIELTEQDRAVMTGFDQVWAASWLLDPDLPGQAGLTRLDINALSLISRKLRIEEVKKLNLSREEMGDEGWF